MPARPERDEELWNRYSKIERESYAIRPRPEHVPSYALLRLSEEIAEEARAEEREACARIVETQYRRDADLIDEGWTLEGAKSNMTKRIAAAIRSRSRPSPREPEAQKGESDGS